MEKTLNCKLSNGLGVLLFLSVLLGGCGGGIDLNIPTIPEEPTTTVQQKMPLAEFNSVLAKDPRFQGIVEFAQNDKQSGDIVDAFILGDAEGAQLILAKFDTPADPGAAVIRHCQNNDCIYAYQVLVDGQAKFSWTTAQGSVPIRQMSPPFLLRIIDEADPDGSAVIGQISQDLRSQISNESRDLSSEIKSFVDNKNLARSLSARASTNRKLRIVSAFSNDLFKVKYDDLVEQSNESAYPNASVTYNVQETQVDELLSSLGPDDAFVLVAHGDVSKSKKRAVGMSVGSSSGHDSHHYNESQIQRQLDANFLDGPGIIFFAGCETAGLLETFDDENRIFLGFSKDNFEGGVSKAVKLFFEHWNSGATLGEAIAAVNASSQMKKRNNQLVANTSADLGRRVTDPTEVDAAGEIFGTVTDASNNQALSGATIRLDIQPVPIQRTSASNGKYSLRIPEGAPKFFAITASHEGYIPQTKNLSISEDNQLLVDFSLKPQNEDIVVINAIPDVHHLGNDNFSGDINSKFQKTAEGLSYTTSFTVSAGQLPPNYTNAKIWMLSKGAQLSNPIFINGTILPEFLRGSPSDGSFGEFTFEFDIGLLEEGNNTLKIESGYSDDYDDFEFVNVQIHLN